MSVIKIKYERKIEEYYSDEMTGVFTSLEELAKWIFFEVWRDHKYVSFCEDPEDSGHMAGEPFPINFYPSSGGFDSIHLIVENGKTVFSDGYYTDGRKCWTKGIKDWLASK